ncbi:ran-binding protein 9-like [Pipra filicauda]|uniref:Ran-binding protein 9-like n=1 Tax=Pipra filicauda TaxID=649802 RepID=A0A7R5KPN9_9PASS|nr:ran-binding protein 9-like [Pipra filicauda]
MAPGGQGGQRGGRGASVAIGRAAPPAPAVTAGPRPGGAAPPARDSRSRVTCGPPHPPHESSRCWIHGRLQQETSQRTQGSGITTAQRGGSLHFGAGTQG